MSDKPAFGDIMAALINGAIASHPGEKVTGVGAAMLSAAATLVHCHGTDAASCRELVRQQLRDYREVRELVKARAAA